MDCAYYFLCLAVGRLLRSTRYSTAQIVYLDGVHVRKRRTFYAPLLVWLGDPLLRVLNTGVRVLPQGDWEAQERRLYWSFHGASIRIETDGALVLPCLPGQTLAALLEDREVGQPVRQRAIELAVAALAAFHHRECTHGDAMAENVLIANGVAHWFDFETIHEPARPIAWRRADDVRALLVTCLVRTVPEERAGIVQLILDAYPDKEVTSVLASTFSSVFRRALAFHLAQAPLSFECFREVALLVRERSGEQLPR